MTTSVVTDMNLGQNGGSKQIVNGGGGGRRKTKGSHLTQKKNKLPKRGMGVELLERIRMQTEMKTMADAQSFHPHQLQLNPSVGFTTSGCTGVTNVAGSGHFRHAHVHTPTPAMIVHGTGIQGGNLYSMDPSVIGSSSGGFRFENSKELSSISSYVKCASDGCGVCHKKMLITGGSSSCSVSPFRNFSGNNTVVEMMDAGKSRRRSGQVTEVMPVQRSGGGSLTEYEFFPGNKELVRATSTATWCGSGGSVAGTLGLRGGEGSCVTAITGGEEGSVSSVDLSLKLSY